MPPELKTDRIVFLDNLRYLMVLLVVVLHAAISYSNFAPWWCVKEVNSQSLFFDIAALLFGAFLMPVLFFIAGYFAVSSFQNKGFLLFLRRKLKRLGLPLLLGIPLTSPAFTYIHHHTRFGLSEHVSLGQFWIQYLQRAGDIRIDFIDSVDRFNQMHLWFMSLLLFFFILFSLHAGIRKRQKAPGTAAASRKSSSKSILFLMLAVSFVSAISAITATLLFASAANPDPWVNISGILQFQTTQVVTYALYFSMGIYAFRHRWFISVDIPGHAAVWAFICIPLALCLLIVAKHLSQAPSLGPMIILYLVRSALCVSILALLTKWAVYKWNRPSPIHARLASSSYHIYIIHFLLVILFQWLLAGWTGGPIFIKFAIVAAGSILASFGISQYALKPFPRLSVFGLYVLFSALLAFDHFGVA